MADWPLPPPSLPALFLPPPLLAAALEEEAACPADAALLVRAAELGRALDTGTAVARAQWAGWVDDQVSVVRVYDWMGGAGPRDARRVRGKWRH
jgi:hypothetical protein